MTDLRFRKNFGLAALRRRVRAFAPNDAGTTAVEFGLLALPFFALTCAIMETAVVSLASNVFESALHDTTREIRTGQIQKKMDDEGYDLESFRADICERTFGLFTCSDIMINVRTAATFSDAALSEPIDPDTQEWALIENFQPGGGRSVMVAEIYYKWHTLFDIMGFNLASMQDGTVLMGTAEVWRNEPFS